MGCPLTARSLWLDTAPLEPSPDGPLTHDRTADVVVVGAGYTGLWTALYLAEADPALDIVVLEAEHAGFGASGRNGGWCSALFPASMESLAALPGSSREAAQAQGAAMRASVDEVGDMAQRHGIDCDFRKGGTLVLARSGPQLARAQAEVEHAREWAIPGVEFLDETAARSRLDAAGTIGATYTPHCAALHPGRLARGLTAAVRRAGVTVHEHTRVVRIEPGRVVTERGTVSAPRVVRATEGYTASLAGLERELVPVYSLIVATEPLPEETWERIGLRRRETFSDHRHLIVYGQRTADDRLVFGGRGSPYHLGSRTRPEYDADRRVFAGLRETLVEMFPVLAPVRFTHAWGGALGIARDWCASVGLDSDTGIGWAGGYVGDGVSTTNLAGRTLRDLVLGRSTDLTGLPWVGHRSPRWEPEPLRWLGINAGLRAMTLADTEEQLTGRASIAARVVSPLLG